MKIVFLPGMDGTGKLFSPLFNELSEFDCEAIALPQSGPQDYVTLTQYVKEKLPDSPFILVAESFSGPIGASLLKEEIDNIKGIIFVATFLSTPRKPLINIVRMLPLKFLSSLPFVNPFYKFLFLGASANNELVSLFQSTLSSLSSSLIKARLSAIYSLKSTFEPTSLPSRYIQAASDKLIPSDKVIEFTNYFNNIAIKTIDGPHFILQSKPELCSAVITELAHFLMIQEN